MKSVKGKRKKKLKHNTQNLNTKTITECKASSAKNINISKVEKLIVTSHGFTTARKRGRDSRSFYLLFFR